MMFALARFRFTLCVTQPLRLPENKGSLFHGALGHGLKHVSPAFFRMFYPSGQNTDLPRPFVIRVPNVDKTRYDVGEQLVFDWVLFGAYVQHFPICFAAVEALGTQLGLGKDQGRFEIEKVEAVDGADEVKVVYAENQWYGHKTMFNGLLQPVKPCAQINLHLQSRLRLKAQDRLWKETPAFSLLLDRLLGRINTLSRLYQNQELLPRNQRQQLLEQAQNIKLKHNNAYWDDWQRFSGRQKRWMKFGGLLGTMAYEGELTPFLPYLKLGEWVHIGGKTSFGLGEYRLECH